MPDHEDVLSFAGTRFRDGLHEGAVPLFPRHPKQQEVQVLVTSYHLGCSPRSRRGRTREMRSPPRLIRQGGLVQSCRGFWSRLLSSGSPSMPPIVPSERLQSCDEPILT